MNPQIYFEYLKKATSVNDFYYRIPAILKHLSKTVEDEINKSIDANAYRIIDRFSYDYESICKAQQSFHNDPCNIHHPLFAIQMHKYGFRAAMVYLYPKYSSSFNLTRYIEKGPFEFDIWGFDIEYGIDQWPFAPKDITGGFGFFPITVNQPALKPHFAKLNITDIRKLSDLCSVFFTIDELDPDLSEF